MSERARDRGLNRPATPRPGNSQHPSLRIVTSQVRWYAVSRRCRQSHMNARSYTRMHKHTQTHARGKTAKYQCTASGPRHAAESNRERRHTHTHTKLTHKRTHTHTQPLSQLHSTTLRHSDTTIVFLGALSKSQRSEKERRMRAEEKEGGKKGRKSRAESEDAEVIKRHIFLLFCKSRRPRAAFPSKVHPIHDGGGGRTLSIVSVFGKKDISQTWIRMEESVEQHRGWIYCKRRKEKNKDRFSFSSWCCSGGKLRLSCWSFAGSLRFLKRNVDGRGRRRIWERDRKHHEEVRQRGEKEAEYAECVCVCVCKGGGSGGNIARKFLPRKNSLLCRSSQRRDSRLHRLSPSDLLCFYLSLCLSLSVYASTY